LDTPTAIAREEAAQMEKVICHGGVLKKEKGKK
jgi:hypothetical protein